MTGRPVLTAAQMRAAEEAVIAAGTSASVLMERAGQATAETIRRFAGMADALVLCGPGNNGGDGYVIARCLAQRGCEVRVAALGEPSSAAAQEARSGWAGALEAVDQAAPATVLIDALYGTGLVRPLESHVAYDLQRLAKGARLRVAVDLPSGASTDDGNLLSPVPAYDLTITFQALKPAHLLQPAASRMGRVVVADIGVPISSHATEIGRPQLTAAGPSDHKYTRGYAAVIGGEMPGAAALTAAAAARAGAGYVRLIAGEPVAAVPSAVVQSGRGAELLTDARIGALAVGPGLGRGRAAQMSLEQMLGVKVPLVIDADALLLLKDHVTRLHLLQHVPILTPHAGEFSQLFGTLTGSKVDQARAAAERASAVVVFKGTDTVVASPDGRVGIAFVPSSLATAGTGDVLTGVIAAMRARGLDAFEAAVAGVWLHSRAAALAGPVLVADDLLHTLPLAAGECL